MDWEVDTVLKKEKVLMLNIKTFKGIETSLWAVINWTKEVIEIVI